MKKGYELEFRKMKRENDSINRRHNHNSGTNSNDSRCHYHRKGRDSGLVEGKEAIYDEVSVFAGAEGSVDTPI